MKRKVIQLANSTAVISLPSKWVKKWCVKKGDEIDVNEDESRLIVSAGQQTHSKKEEIECNLSGMAPRALMWTLMGVYKAGYDKVKFLYDDTIQLENIHRIVSSLLDGFQVTEEGDNYCVVETVSKEQDTDFLPVFRKALRVIYLFGQSALDCLKSEQYGKLKDVLILEETNNKMSNLSERLVIKGGSIPQNLRCQFFLIAWHSQKICNYYRDICRYTLDKPRLRLSKKLIDLFETTNLIVKEYDQLYTQINIPRMVELYVESRNKVSQINASQFGKEEQPILFNLLFILNRVSDISTMLIGIHETTRHKAMSENGSVQPFFQIH